MNLALRRFADARSHSHFGDHEEVDLGRADQHVAELSRWLQTVRRFPEVYDSHQIYESLVGGNGSQAGLADNSQGVVRRDVMADPGRILMELYAAVHSSLAVHMTREFDSLLEQMLKLCGHHPRESVPAVVLLVANPKDVKGGERVAFDMSRVVAPPDGKKSPKSTVQFTPALDAQYLPVASPELMPPKVTDRHWQWKICDGKEKEFKIQPGRVFTARVMPIASETDKRVALTDRVPESVAWCGDLLNGYWYLLDGQNKHNLEIQWGLQAWFEQTHRETGEPLRLPLDWGVSEHGGVDQLLCWRRPSGVGPIEVNDELQLCWVPSPVLDDSRLKALQTVGLQFNVLPWINWRSSTDIEEQLPTHPALFPRPAGVTDGAAGNVRLPDPGEPDSEKNETKVKRTWKASEPTSDSAEFFSGDHIQLTAADGGRDRESEIEYLERTPTAVRMRGVPVSPADWEFAVRHLSQRGQIAGARARQGEVYVPEQDAWCSGVQIAFHCFGSAVGGVQLANAFEQIGKRSLEWIRPIGTHFYLMPPKLVPGKLVLSFSANSLGEGYVASMKRFLFDLLKLDNPKPQRSELELEMSHSFWQFLLNRFRSPVYRSASLSDQISAYLNSDPAHSLLRKRSPGPDFTLPQSPGFRETESELSAHEPEFPHQPYWRVPWIRTVDDIVVESVDAPGNGAAT